MGYQYRSKYVGAEIDEVLRKVHENDLDWTDLNLETREKIEGLINGAVTNLIRFEERSQFPSIGEEHVLYVALDEAVIYFWKASENVYQQVGGRFEDIKIIDCGGARV